MAYHVLMSTVVGLDTDTIVAVGRRHGASFLAVFGSAARGETLPASDVDLLASFSRQKSLLDLVQIEREISESIGRHVDLLTEASISPYLRERIEAEMKVLYDGRSRRVVPAPYPRGGAQHT